MYGLDLITYEEVSGRRIAVFAVDVNTCRIRVPADPAERERWLEGLPAYVQTWNGGGWPGMFSKGAESNLLYAAKLFQAHQERWGRMGGGAMAISHALPWGTAYVVTMGTTGLPWEDDPLRIVFPRCHIQGIPAIRTYVQNRSDRKHQRPAHRAYLPIHKIRGDQIDHLRLAARLQATDWKPENG